MTQFFSCESCLRHRSAEQGLRGCRACHVPYANCCNRNSISRNVCMPHSIAVFGFGAFGWCWHRTLLLDLGGTALSRGPSLNVVVSFVCSCVLLIAFLSEVIS